MKRILFAITVLIFLSSCGISEPLTYSQYKNRTHYNPATKKWKVSISKKTNYTPRDRGYWDIFNSGKGNLVY